MKYITVWYDGMGITLFPEIAEQFNLHSGARLRDEKQFNDVLRANALCGIAECELGRAIIQDFDTEVQDNIEEKRA